MNSEGIYNYTDSFPVNKSEYVFPEDGLVTIEGITVCRYWGSQGNLILLVNTFDRRKLKFSFWHNTKYCFEPVPKRHIDVSESVRFLADGSHIMLTYLGKPNVITRVRDIKVMG